MSARADSPPQTAEGPDNSGTPPPADPTQDHAQSVLVHLVEALGYEAGEVVAVCHQTAHGGARGMFAHAHVPATADAIGAEASRHVNTSDVWFSVNPVAVPEGYEGRGTAAHVTRWAGTYSDLDVKEGGLPSLEAAEAVINAVSAILGQDPVIVIESGHGLQPGWGMDPEDEGTDLAGDEERRATARALIRRFGRLTTHVASLVDEEHRGRVDSVFDLARVLRLPGTVNRKDPDVPVPTGARFPGGGLLSVAELDDALLACGIAELPGDRDDPGEVRSKPGDWPWAKEACPYARTVVEGWRTDKADDPSQRHQWLVGQSVRLACMHRWGCLTEELHALGMQTLADRMVELCNRGEVRKVQPGEIADALSWGRARAATKTDEEVAREVGGHTRHDGPAASRDPGEYLAEVWDQRPVFRHLHDFARARRAAPAAVLGSAIARAVAMVPPEYVLPPLVGDVGTLNQYFAHVGKSGRGKGAANGAARAALSMRTGPPGVELLAPWRDLYDPRGDSLHTSNVGSGEGLVAMFVAWVPKSRSAPGHLKRTRACGMFTVPEVDHLAAVGARSGATLLPMLRSAWSGEDLSAAYAAQEKRLRIDGHTYRLTLVVGVQPGKAGVLLDDSDGGTPQRFVWLPTDDPGAPQVRPVAPDPMVIRIPPVLTGGARHVIDVAESIVQEIDAIAWQKIQGDDVGPALDGHRPYARLKLAAGLAVLSEHLDTDGVTEDDWRLSGVLMDESDRVREWVVTEQRARFSEANRARAEAEAERVEVIEDSAVQRAARAIRTRLDNLPDGWHAASDLRRDVSSRHRPSFTDAVAVLKAAGAVDVEEVEYQGTPGQHVRKRS